MGESVAARRRPVQWVVPALLEPRGDGLGLLDLRYVLMRDPHWHNGIMKLIRRHRREAPRDEFEIKQHPIDAERHLVAVHGEVGLFTAPELKDALAQCLAEKRNRIVVDLRAVPFMDSTGLGVLIGAYKTAVRAGGAMVLVMSAQNLLATFHITGLDTVFPIVDTRDAAVELIGDLTQQAATDSLPDVTALRVTGQTPLSPSAGSRPARIFMCHSKANKAEVRTLYDRLIHAGLSPWLDEEDLQPGEDWELAINHAVRDSDYILVCLSSASMTQAGYVHKEIRLALDVAERQPEGKVFIIPARLDDCVVPTRLSHLQWVDLFHPAGYARLERVLKVRG